jgi:hypothetical protein
MVLVLMTQSITSAVKLHLTKRPLVPSPVASSSSSLLWTSGSPRNGSSSSLTKRAGYRWRSLTRPTRRHGLAEPCRNRKARKCYDGSKVPLQSFASLKRTPRLFFALFAAMVLVLTGADCTNACVNAPSPTQPTYVRIDDLL